MNVGFILIGVGIGLILIVAAGLLTFRAENPFKGSVLDEQNDVDLFADGKANNQMYSNLAKRKPGRPRKEVK